MQKYVKLLFNNILIVLLFRATSIIGVRNDSYAFKMAYIRKHTIM